MGRLEEERHLKKKTEIMHNFLAFLLFKIGVYKK